MILPSLKSRVLRSGPRARVRRPDRWFNSIHCRRSAKLKTSRRPRRCSLIGPPILRGRDPVGTHTIVGVKKKEGRPAPPATTSSGIPILPFYGEPAPGEFPFTRGLSPEGYRQRFWTMRQYAGFGSARESNRRYRYLLAQGQT